MQPDITQLLDAVRRGEEDASQRLMKAVYAELRTLAAAKLAREAPGQTIQATVLVHEAYLRLFGGSEGAAKDWKERRYFFAASAEAMRRILVDRARRRQRLRHGGDRERVPLDDVEPVEPPLSVDLLALDDALDQLAEEAPRKAELVKLRFFTGLTMDQAAEALEISTPTAERDWAFARAWLYDRIGGPEATP